MATKIPYVIGLPDPFHVSRGELWITPYSNSADFTYKTEEGANGTLYMAVFYATTKSVDVFKPFPLVTDGPTRVFYKEKGFGVGAQGNIRINGLFSETDYLLAYYIVTSEGESPVITKPFKTRFGDGSLPPEPPPDEPYEPDEPNEPEEPEEPTVTQYFDRYFDQYFR